MNNRLDVELMTDNCLWLIYDDYHRNEHHWHQRTIRLSMTIHDTTFIDIIHSSLPRWPPTQYDLINDRTIERERTTTRKPRTDDTARTWRSTSLNGNWHFITIYWLIYYDYYDYYDLIHGDNDVTINDNTNERTTEHDQYTPSGSGYPSSLSNWIRQGTIIIYDIITHSGTINIQDWTTTTDHTYTD